MAHPSEGPHPDPWYLEIHNIAKLEESIKDLRVALTELQNLSDVDALVPVIHRPGWTTPAEFALFAALVNAMTTHARALSNMHRTLVFGANRVGATTSVG